jgi:hypothetical protein
VTPTAHTGHWGIVLAMVFPFAAALVWAVVVTIRERRRRREQ